MRVETITIEDIRGIPFILADMKTDNISRRNLTTYEKSKTIVELADAVGGQLARGAAAQVEPLADSSSAYFGILKGSKTRRFAKAYPSAWTGHWHLAAIIEAEVTYTNHPEPQENVAFWFDAQGFDLADFTWGSSPSEPLEHNPFYKLEPPKLRLVQPEPESKTSYVYFIQAETTGLIKIGVTNKPATRLKALQTGSPMLLRPLGLIEGDTRLEAALHAQFKHLRRHGEWFEPSAELLAFIKERAKAWPSKTNK